VARLRRGRRVRTLSATPLVIRPARQRAPAPPAGATGTAAGMQPAMGVVPAGSGPIGATKPPVPVPAPPAETPAEPATDGNTEETPPPP